MAANREETVGLSADVLHEHAVVGVAVQPVQLGHSCHHLHTRIENMLRWRMACQMWF